MTREKAIRHFERYVNDDCYTTEHRDACRMAVAALREQEERRWIPVSELLPVKSGNYLVMVDGICMIVHYSARHKAFNSFDSLDDRESGELSMDCTHWMPLPEPPKEEK